MTGSGAGVFRPSGSGLSAALVSLRLGAALSALLAKGLALAVGLAWTWTLNQRWTFRPARSER